MKVTPYTSLKSTTMQTTSNSPVQVPSRWKVDARAWLVVFNLGGPANPHYLYAVDAKEITEEISKATRFTNFDLAHNETLYWKLRGYRENEKVPFYTTASLMLEPIAGWNA